MDLYAYVPVISGVSLIAEDLMCLYNFDSDSYGTYGEELYAVTLFGFFFSTRIVYTCFAFCPCQPSNVHVWISTVIIILVELAQAILMLMFVDSFDGGDDNNKFFIVFGLAFGAQLVCEVAMANNNGDGDNGNDDNGNNRNVKRAQIYIF